MKNNANLYEDDQKVVEKGIMPWETKYFTRSEIVLHNQKTDCWLCWNGIVADLTDLVAENEGEIGVAPIICMAGKDVSHWFDSDGELLTCFETINGNPRFFLKMGALLHVNNIGELTVSVPWWKDEDLLVCEEDTLLQIKNKYKPFNSNINSYTWKYEKQILDMEKTLTENGIVDRRQKLNELRISDTSVIPCIFLYYNDDLK